MYRGTAHTQEDAQLQLHKLACAISGHGGHDRLKGSSRKGCRTLHDAQPVTQVAVSQRLHNECEQNRECMVQHTWVSRVTVGALVIAWHRMYQLLQNRLVTRLLALAQGARHDAVVALGQYVLLVDQGERSGSKCARKKVEALARPGCSSICRHKVSRQLETQPGLFEFLRLG